MTKTQTKPEQKAEPKIDTPPVELSDVDVALTLEARKRIQRYISDLEDAIRYKLEENQDYGCKISRMEEQIEKNRAKIDVDMAVVQILKGKV